MSKVTNKEINRAIEVGTLPYWYSVDDLEKMLNDLLEQRAQNDGPMVRLYEPSDVIISTPCGFVQVGDHLVNLATIACIAERVYTPASTIEVRLAGGHTILLIEDEGLALKAILAKWTFPPSNP